MKKGFTLVELLAVILILAIIALIAVPIMFNMVEGSKKATSLSNAKMYARGINSSILSAKVESNLKIPNGQYAVNSSGNVCLNNGCTEVLEVEVNGKKPTGGTVLIEDEIVTCVYNLTYSNYVITCDANNEFVVAGNSNNNGGGNNNSGNDNSGNDNSGNNSGNDNSGNNSEEGGNSNCIGAGCILGPGGHGGGGSISTESDSEPADSEWQGCYKISSSNNAIVDYSTDSSCTKDVDIPNNINGVSIESIWGQAFKNKSLTSVKFPASINSIGSKAFELNPDLTSIYFQSCPVLYSDSFITGIATSSRGINQVRLPDRSCRYNPDSFSLRPSCTEVSITNAAPGCPGCCFEVPYDTDPSLSSD